MSERFRSTRFEKQSLLLIGVLLAFILFLSTLQLTINGSSHPYATDVGEIQNALPRWGTLHFPGYHLYSLTGSTFVTLARFLGIEPAISASLLSAIWGAIAIALLITLDNMYDVPMPAGVVTALLFALSTSFWIDASIAEVHTLTIGLMLATLIFAIRFGRHGHRSDLLWLAFFASQALLHQRALVFMGPGLLILVLQKRRSLWRGLPLALIVGLLGFIVYLYLPIRDWQGAEWTFNQPGTWRGFWSLVSDTKTERIISLPTSADEWFQRVRGVGGLLTNDWPIYLLGLGLLGTGVIAIRGKRLEALAIIALWVPYIVLSIVIWEGRISDALLAVNLPVVALSALGLGVISAEIYKRSRWLGIVLIVLWGVMGLYLYMEHRPMVLTVTRDASAQELIEIADRVVPGDDGRPITMMALWGNDYWALAYAQAYQGRLTGINLVDHNANLAAILNSDNRLITLSQTFYLRPPTWWEKNYGPIHLSSFSPEVIEVSNQPPLTPVEVVPNQSFDLGNGIAIRRAEINNLSPRLLHLTVYWETLDEPEADYSVAVHLVEQDPPSDPSDILAQADRDNPVNGWYPTSKWKEGEIVRDDYLIPIREESSPIAIRLGMYRVQPNGEFLNTEWLSLKLNR